MNELIPNRFLFDLEFTLAHREVLPSSNGDLSAWTTRELIPKLGAVDGVSDFADVWGCWNETGLAIACRVGGKKKPLRCNPSTFWKGDNLRLCTDMRDARSNKRGTRYCQHFYFLPTGGGRGKHEAVAGVAKLQRARENAPDVPASRIRATSRLCRDGYELQAMIPAECLSGFDPVEHPRIGFYYMLEDGDHGQQYLTVGDDLNWFFDPSTWATARLARPKSPHR